MRFFVEMDGNFTSTFFSDHRRLVVAETNFKFIASGTNKLHITFLARDQVNDNVRFATKNLSNRISPASASASASVSKTIAFF